MANDNTFMRGLAERYGTGIAARADAAGNHVFSSEIANSYAQAGQVVPANLQGALRELNDITQSESLLANASPTARMNLRGAGYDATGRRARVAELEQFLMNSSADVRNLSQRLENDYNAQRVRDLEMTNNMNEATFQSRLDATLSANSAAIAQNRQAATSIERAAETDKIIEATMNSGLSIDQLYEIWNGNDPSLLRQTFGTANRAAAHDALATMTTALNQQDAQMITRMGNTVTMPAHQLASNGDISTADLMKYANGELELPQGVSMLAIGEAMQRRQEIEAARVQFGAIDLAAETNAAQLAQMATATMSPLQKLQEIATALGADMATMQEQVYNDPGAISEISDALAKLPNITVTTANGTTVSMAPMALLQSFITDMQNQQAAATVALSTNVNMRRFMHEQRDTQRIIETTMSMAVGLPSETRIGMQAMMGQSVDLFAAAAREQDPARQAALIETAQQAAQQARNLAADALRATGAPEYVVEDITQGRFSSGESVKAALVSAVGFSDASFRGHPFGAALSALLKERGIRPADFDRWAQDPNASLTDLNRDRLIGTSGQVTDGHIISIVQDSAGYVAGNVMLDALLNSSLAQFLPDDAQELLSPLVDGSMQGVSATDYQRRIVSAGVMLERMILREQEQAARNGDENPGPAYQRGAIFRVMQDALNNSDELAKFIAGSPNGVPSREMAGFLTEFNRSVLGVPTHGEGAVAFEDIVPTTVRALQTTFAQNLAGVNLQQQGTTQLQISSRAYAFGEPGAVSQTAAAILRQGGPARQTAGQRQAQASVEMAIMRLMMRDLSNPDRRRPENFLSGLVYDLGAKGLTRADIENELRSMGLDPDAVRTAMKSRE